MNRSRSNSLDYLDGLAIHWYVDSIIGPSVIDRTHAEMPNKTIINTESCLGSSPFAPKGPLLGSWERGETYVRSFIQNFQHHYNGWIDWNLVLDEQGGPNYVQNYVDSGIIANLTNRAEIYKQPIFYALGHFSKFVPEGSIRIQNTQFYHPDVDSVAFRRPDAKIALVLLNGGRSNLDVVVNDSLRGHLTINVPARSFHTIIYK